jgi:hypothetical protein
MLMEWKTWELFNTGILFDMPMYMEVVIDFRFIGLS